MHGLSRHLAERTRYVTIQKPKQYHYLNTGHQLCVFRLDPLCSEAHGLFFAYCCPLYANMPMENGANFKPVTLSQYYILKLKNLWAIAVFSLQTQTHLTIEQLVHMSEYRPFLPLCVRGSVVWLRE